VIEKKGTVGGILGYIYIMCFMLLVDDDDEKFFI
jgi:hypothetical protein